MLFVKFSILFCSVDVYLFKTAQEKRSAAYFLQSEDEGLVIKHWLGNHSNFAANGFTQDPKPDNLCVFLVFFAVLLVLVDSDLKQKIVD